MFEPRANRPIEVVFPHTWVFVLESRHGKPFRMPDTAHDFLKVICVVSGEGRLVRGGSRDPLQAGDVALVPSGCRHRIEDVRPLSLYAVCIRPDILAASPSSAGGLGKYRLFHLSLGNGEVRELIRELLHEQTLERPGGDALVLGLTWQLLGRLLRAAGERGRAGGVARSPAKSAAPRAQVARVRVAAYVRELERRFFEPLAIDAEAGRLGLGRRRFTQLFREEAGDSWLNTLRAHRLAHARRLLRDTGRSVASICFECGFEDLSNFYRAFRAAEGA
ncbi:MAG: AraC family transcriptional regulator, partial [Lacunisphaera sp.]|nr:AraC family transcriptional regulator [Lacunisphaera sp.]